MRTESEGEGQAERAKVEACCTVGNSGDNRLQASEGEVPQLWSEGRVHPVGSRKKSLDAAFDSGTGHMVRLLAWDVVARLFGVSWNTVRSAVAAAVAYGVANRDTGSVLYIGIDEISRRQGHIYHTQVYDLEGKRLLWSAEGRDADTLRRFFEEMGGTEAQQHQGRMLRYVGTLYRRDLRDASRCRRGL